MKFETFDSHFASKLAYNDRFEDLEKYCLPFAISGNIEAIIFMIDACKISEIRNQEILTWIDKAERNLLDGLAAVWVFFDSRPKQLGPESAITEQAFMYGEMLALSGNKLALQSVIQKKLSKVELDSADTQDIDFWNRRLAKVNTSSKGG
jgi:hypothetical protein